MMLSAILQGLKKTVAMRAIPSTGIETGVCLVWSISIISSLPQLDIDKF